MADQHDAAIDDEIAGEQVAQDFAARLAATTEQAAVADALSRGIYTVIIAVDGDTFGESAAEQFADRIGNETIVRIQEHDPAAFALLVGEMAFDFRKAEIARGRDAASAA